MNSQQGYRWRAWVLSVLLHAALIGYLANMSSPEPNRLRSVPVVLFTPRPANRSIVKATKPVRQSSIRPQPRAFHIPAPAPQPVSTPPHVSIPEPPVILKTEIPQPEPAPQIQENPLARVVKPSGFSSVDAGGIAPARRARTETGAFDSVPAGPDHPSASGKIISSGTFGDASIAVSASQAPSREKKTSNDATFAPAEIISKPRPLYTDEARDLRMEGEVLLEILFRASGEAHVLRIISGLGHGLDQNAIAAASAIQFRPARRGDVPVDSTAVVHILFQLAY